MGARSAVRSGQRAAASAQRPLDHGPATSPPACLSASTCACPPAAWAGCLSSRYVRACRHVCWVFCPCARPMARVLLGRPEDFIIHPLLIFYPIMISSFKRIAPKVSLSNCVTNLGPCPYRHPILNFQSRDPRFYCHILENLSIFVRVSVHVSGVAPRDEAWPEPSPEHGPGHGAGY